MDTMIPNAQCDCTITNILTSIAGWERQLCHSNTLTRIFIKHSDDTDDVTQSSTAYAYGTNDKQSLTAMDCKLPIVCEHYIKYYVSIMQWPCDAG